MSHIFFFNDGVRSGDLVLFFYSFNVFCSFWLEDAFTGKTSFFAFSVFKIVKVLYFKSSYMYKK